MILHSESESVRLVATAAAVACIRQLGSYSHESMHVPYLVRYSKPQIVSDQLSTSSFAGLSREAFR